MAFTDIVGSEYVLLTTFTRDGRPKPTPIWAAPYGDGLIVITAETSWKVKRIRVTPSVTLAACDMRGKPKSEAVDATARILDRSRTGDAYRAIDRRYGIRGRTFTLFSKLRGGMKNNVALELTARR